MVASALQYIDTVITVCNLFRGQLWGQLRRPARRLHFGGMSADARSILAPRQMNDTEPSAASKKSKTSAAAVTPAPITTLRVRRLTPDATLPRRGSERAAGYDLARYELLARCMQRPSPSV